MSSTAEYKPPELEPTTAQCNCGAVKLKLNKPVLTIGCHCHDCRARTGAPFVVGLISLAKDVDVDAKEGQVVTYGKFHEDGSNKGPRVNFCKTCGTNTHFSVFGGNVIQVPLGLTGLKDTVEEPGFHVFQTESVPCSSGVLKNATVPVFDGMFSGPAKDHFMSVVKGED